MEKFKKISSDVLYISRVTKVTKKKMRRRKGSKNKDTETIKSKDKVSNEEMIGPADDTTKSTSSEIKIE